MDSFILFSDIPSDRKDADSQLLVESARYGPRWQHREGDSIPTGEKDSLSGSRGFVRFFQYSAEKGFRQLFPKRLFLKVKKWYNTDKKEWILCIILKK